jgi:DNA-binding transcriptional MocR family regulator
MPLYAHDAADSIRNRKLAAKNWGISCQQSGSWRWSSASNANTVAKVYAELEREGVLETRRGVGTFVGARHFEAKNRQDHEALLRDLVDRFIEEAGAMGFSADDLLNQLQNRRKKETKKNV